MKALDIYLLEAKWANSIVDICVYAAAKCFSVNICIFKNIDGRLLQLPIPMSGFTTARKYITDCFRHHLENGHVKEAFNLCDAVSEANVVDRIKKMRNYANKSVNRKDLIESCTVPNMVPYRCRLHTRLGAPRIQPRV